MSGAQDRPPLSPPSLPWRQRWPLKYLMSRPDDPPMKAGNIVIGWGMLGFAALAIATAGSVMELLVACTEVALGFSWLMMPRTCRYAYRRGRDTTRGEIVDALREARLRGWDLHQFQQAETDRLLGDFHREAMDP